MRRFMTMVQTAALIAIAAATSVATAESDNSNRSGFSDGRPRIIAGFRGDRRVYYNREDGVRPRLRLEEKKINADEIKPATGDLASMMMEQYQCENRLKKVEKHLRHAKQRVRITEGQSDRNGSLGQFWESRLHKLSKQKYDLKKRLIALKKGTDAVFASYMNNNSQTIANANTTNNNQQAFVEPTRTPASVTTVPTADVAIVPTTASNETQQDAVTAMPGTYEPASATGKAVLVGESAQ